ncbi:hypothetical protein P7996_15795, partial [Staphylococcus aureus]|nr:hypothetical protein [Staphylococcus aureus]
ATGMSRPFLNQVENNGIAHTVAYVESFIEHMKSIMTMLDAKKYGNSPKAYLVVPIVGAFLIDLIGVIVIMGFIQWFS